MSPVGRQSPEFPKRRLAVVSSGLSQPSSTRLLADRMAKAIEVDSGSSTLPDRIERAAGELATLVSESERSNQVRDPFALPAGFSPVGGYGTQ